MRLALENGVKLTRHAREVMILRDFAPEEIADVLREPEIIVPNRGLWHVKRGEITVVAARSEDDSVTVVTVLLNRLDQWTNADAVQRAA